MCAYRIINSAIFSRDNLHQFDQWPQSLICTLIAIGNNENDKSFISAGQSE